jgi:hypothetical protein
MIREFVPILIQDINQGHIRLLEPLLDLLLLPLALHVFILCLLLWAAPVYACFALSIVFAHIVVALWIGKATLKDVLVLCSVPFYIMWKLRTLPRLILASRQNATWVRTQRD